MAMQKKIQRKSNSKAEREVMKDGVKGQENHNNDNTANVDESEEDDDNSTNNKSRRTSSNDDGDEMNAVPSTPLSKILTLAKPEWSILFLCALIMIGSEATGLYNPVLIGTAYDDLINPNLDSASRMSNINQTMMIAIIIHFAGVAGYFIRYALFQIIGERVVARLRSNLYSAILHQDIAFFDTNKSGELLSRLTSDTTLLQHGTTQSLPAVCVGIIKIITALAIMFWISPKLAGVMLGFVFVVTAIAAQFGKILGSLSKQYQDILGSAQSYSAQALQAMRTVQSFSAEDKELQRYVKKIGDPHEFKYWYPTNKSKKTISHSDITQTTNNGATTYSIGFFKSMVTSGLFSMIFGIGFAGMLLCLWYGFKLVNDGELTLGNLTAFQSYIFVIGGSLGETSNELSKLIEAKGVAGRVFYLLERVPAIPTKGQIQKRFQEMKGSPKAENNSVYQQNTNSAPSADEAETVQQVDEEVPETPLKPELMHGAVDFNNVVFSYPTRPDVNVLKNFSLSVPANQTAALVGASGSGKSTCIALLQRFYDVSEGSITVDGHDIRNLDLQWLRRHMAYVQQEPHLFGLSIRDNILYGVDRDDVSQDEIEEVAKKANAYEFISQWPNKFDTLVGERGVQLSGGQKQRIAIARALIRQPRILLLDEATSALDAESEHLVQEAIDNAIVGRTVLVVAHRLSTIQRANQIVVVDDHQIVDVGTHQELSLRCSKYQDLIKRQSIIYQQDKDPLEIIAEGNDSVNEPGIFDKD